MKKIAILFSIFLIPLSFGFAQSRGVESPPPPEPGQEMGMQNHPPRDPGQEMGMGNPEVRRQLEQIKIWQMTKEMNLPTDKAEKFFPLYNNYNDELKRITAERRRLIIGLDTAIKNRMSDAEIQKQIQQIVGLDNQLADSHVKFIQSLGQILTPTEVAKYMVFEQKFAREIRDRIRMIMQQRMRGRPR